MRAAFDSCLRLPERSGPRELRRSSVRLDPAPRRNAHAAARAAEGILTSRNYYQAILTRGRCELVHKCSSDHRPLVRIRDIPEPEGQVQQLHVTLRREFEEQGNPLVWYRRE